MYKANPSNYQLIILNSKLSLYTDGSENKRYIFFAICPKDHCHIKLGLGLIEISRHHFNVWQTETYTVRIILTGAKHNLSGAGNNSSDCKLELGRYRYFRLVSVFGIFLGIFKSCYWYRYFKISRYRYRYFFPTITIRHVLKNRDPIFPYLLVPYHVRVSKQSATLVRLFCSTVCVWICVRNIFTPTEWTNHLLSNRLGYYTSRISINFEYRARFRSAGRL